MKGTKRGFTLIEIAVTALLIGVALVPIFNMLSYGNRHTGKTRKMVMATYLAVESLEIIKQMDFDEVIGQGKAKIQTKGLIYANIVKNKKTYAYDTTEGGMVSYGPEYRDFYREIAIIQGQQNPDIKRVQVTVGWGNEKKKDAKSSKIVLFAVLIRDNL